MNRWVASLLLSAAGSTGIACHGQSEVSESLSEPSLVADTVSVAGYTGPATPSVIEYPTPQVYPHRFIGEGLTHYSESYPIHLLFSSEDFTPGQANLFEWNNGALIASGNNTEYIGMMGVESGSIDFHQSVGKLSINAGATANKYGWYQGLHTQYGVHGSLIYQFSPKWSATIFGSYYFSGTPTMAGGMPLPPSMLGYYDYTRFGGYVTYQINDRFGVHAGAQVVRHTYGAGYEVEPILNPYIKVGRKKNIEIDLPVGQIIYEIFRATAQKYSK